GTPVSYGAHLRLPPHCTPSNARTSPRLEDLNVESMMSARISDKLDQRSRASPACHRAHAVFGGCPVVEFTHEKEGSGGGPRTGALPRGGRPPMPRRWPARGTRRPCNTR